MREREKELKRDKIWERSIAESRHFDWNILDQSVFW